MKLVNVIALLSLWSVVACGQSTHEVPTVPSSEMNNPTATPSAPVTTVVVNGRTILADRNGMSVYTFDVDTTSESKCYDDCAVKWPAVLLTLGESVTAPFGTTIRKDGSVQLTFNGHPLYLFFLDRLSGDIKGDDLGSVWHLVPFN